MVNSKIKSELDRYRHQCFLLEQARDMVQRAVRQGWMAYPPYTRFDDDGRPLPNLH